MTPLDAGRAGRATTFALAATALEKGGAMVLLLLIARMLGAEDFGRYAALMALVAFAQLGADFGQEPVLVRLLAQRSAGEGTAFVDAAFATRLALGVVAGALVIALGSRVLPAMGVAPLALAAAGVLAGSGAVLRAVFRATHRLERLCGVALAGVGAFAVALVVSRAFDGGLSGAVGAWAVGQLAMTVAALAAVADPRPLAHRRPRAAMAATLARSGWALAANAMLLTVTLRVGQVVVLRAVGAVESGYLAAGSRLAEAFALLPEALMLVVLPVLSAYDLGARAAQQELSVRIVRCLGVLALGVIVAASIAAPTLVGLLFGVAYVPAAAALRVSIWLALLAATGAVFTNLLIARGLERVLLGVNAATSLLTIVLTVSIVPRFGFVAAAVVSLAANALSQVLLAFVPAIAADVAACVRPLRVPVAVAVALVVLGTRLPGSPVVLALVASAVFALATLGLGAVGPEDWSFVRRAFTPPRAAAPD